MKTHEKYAPTCRVKVPLQNPRAARIWSTADRSRIDSAEEVDWLSSECVPRAVPKSVWWQNVGQWGVVWEATDIAVSQTNLEFPFDE